MQKKEKKIPLSVNRMIIVYNHHFTIGPHAVIMHSAGLCCASDMIVQLIMPPVIIRFLEVEGCVKVPWVRQPFIKKTPLLFSSWETAPPDELTGLWCGNHSSSSKHPVKETKSSKPQITPIIHPLHKPVFLLMPPFSLWRPLCGRQTGEIQFTDSFCVGP